MIKFVQIILNHCKMAQDCIHKYAEEWEAGVVIVCDAYKTDKSWKDWLVDTGTGQAAIWVRNNLLPIADIETGVEFVSATIGGQRVYRCYASPRMTLAQFEDYLNQLDPASGPISQLLSYW